MKNKTAIYVTLCGLGLATAALIGERLKEGSPPQPPPIQPQTPTITPRTPAQPIRQASPPLPPQKAVEREVPPQIQFDQETVDYGEVLQGTEATRIFTMRNQGKGILRIIDVNTTCECAVMLPEKREIPPGGSIEMKITFKTGSLTGPQHKTISVRSNDPNRIVVILHLNARVTPVFVFDPPMLNFGELPRGSETSREFSMRETRGRTFAVETATASIPHLKVDALPDGGQDGAVRRFKVTLAPDRNPGSFTASIGFKIDRPDIKPTLVVQGAVLGNVSIQPESLFFGMSRQGQSFPQQAVVVRSRDASPVYIPSVDTGVSWIKATVVPLDRSKAYRIDLVVDPLPPPGRFDQAIRITTSDSTLPYVVTVSGVVRRADEGIPTTLPSPPQTPERNAQERTQ
jgi:hypothetical protein